ncbi:YciI family protein [Winogradskyella maritima]|uniref:YciI family protein n=1 Tax=Winogradskyella maritima TaxID=1517766 RepID=A0ABV8AGM7_9FLAO|nr:YciI family protein [Winogradskyella maritima]
MKYIATLVICLLSLQLATAQKTNPNYDAELAEKVGADEYGMKLYVFVMLKTGENTSKEKEPMDKAFAGHMANINRLVEEGKLIVAGPMQPNDNNYRGIFILDVRTIEEAEKLMQTDPAIKAKYLKPDLYQWYGSAALPEYLPASDKVWKVGF